MPAASILTTPAPSDNLTTMTRRRPPRLKPLLTSLLLLIVLGGAATAFFWPSIYLWHRLGYLTSHDLRKREAALNYVIQRGPHNPAVIAGAVRKLDVGDQQNFLQIINALDRARAWRRSNVPDDPWLRWLGILSRDPRTLARVMTARRLGDLKDLPDDPRVRSLVERLQNDAEDDVRYNALVAAAELAGRAKSLDAWKPLLACGAEDPNAQIARQGWVFLGLFRITGEAKADWKAAPPAVAAAMIWAKLFENPSDPAIAIEALRDPAAPDLVRAVAAYALHQSPRADAQSVFLGVIDNTPTKGLTLLHQRLLWRTILALSPETLARTDVRVKLNALAEQAVHAPAPERPLAAPIAIAISYRLGTRYSFPPKPVTQPGDTPTRPLADQLSLLAALEGQKDGQSDGPIPDDAPELTRLTWVARKTAPLPEDFMPFCMSEDSMLRDLACVAAADRLDLGQINALVTLLLRDFDDRAKMSGAILAGLTNSRPPTRGENGEPSDLVLDKVNAEDVRPVMQVMRVGLWMQGRAPDMEKVIDGLFGRPDMPRSTLLLALLHGKSPIPFDYILNPRGDPPFDLVDYFDTQRWWRIASRYLPADAPPFWVWGDRELEEFQIDVLRNWYLIHRDDMYPNAKP